MSHKVSELNNLLPGIFDFIDPNKVVSDKEFEDMKTELEKYLAVRKCKLKEQIMTNPFEKPVLEKIIDSDYPTETKVIEIMSLYEQSRQQMLNDVRNELTGMIDTFKYGRES